jgi:hypothetical protein
LFSASLGKAIAQLAHKTLHAGVLLEFGGKATGQQVSVITRNLE